MMKIRPDLTLLLVISLIVTAGIGTAAAAPPAPTAIGPANGASVQVPFTISWSAVTDPSGIAGYNWKVSPSPSLTPVILRDSTNSNVTQDTVSGLVPGTYFWQVQAANSLGEQGAWSVPRSFTVTGAGPGTPGTPVLNPTRGYSTFHPEESITFTWSAVPDAVTYRLEVSDDPGFPLDRVFPNFQTFWNDNIPTNTDGFRWGVSLGEGNFVARVFAVSADNPQEGIRSVPSNVISFSVFFNNPIGPAPVLLSPINGETLTLPFALTWEHVPNPQSSGYDGQISSSPTFSTLETPLFAQLTEPRFNIFSLSSGTKFWRVRSNHGLASFDPDTGASTNAVTAWSATGTFTISTAPPRPASIELQGVPHPQTVYSGLDRGVTVELTAEAPTGTSIALTSSDPVAAPVPPTIATTLTTAITGFAMTAGQVIVPTPVTLTATLNGVSASGELTVLPPSLKLLRIEPAIINGGAQVGVTVELNGRAPAGGAVVSLSSNSPAVSLPATTTIPAGSFAGGVSVFAGTVATDTVVTITASWNGASVQSLLTVSAQAAVPTSLTLFPSWVIGDVGSSTGSVTIAPPAVPFDRFLQVTSNNTTVLPFLSSTVMVPAFATTGSFLILHRFVTVPTIVTISVTGGGVTKSADLSVNPSGTPPPPGLSSFTVSPASVTGGSPSTGTVSLASAAPSGGTVVSLSSQLPGSASVPASVTIPAGATSASFTVTTFPVAATTVQLTATLGDTILFAPITVTSPASSVLNAVTVNPTSVAGGTSSTGTVTLSAAAPSGGAVVTLSDDSTATTVPASVTVPAGATSATFTVTTTSVTTATTATISGTGGGVTRSATLTVNPEPPPAPAAPTLVSPAADATVAQPVTLDWNDVAAATSYEVQVATTSKIAAPFNANPTVTVSQVTLTGLPAQRLWWRVRAQNAAGVFGPFSSTRRFTPTATPWPASLSAVSVSPTSVVGGASATGTATLTAAAPTGGAVVTLSDDSTAATVPASVTVLAGATSATFTVTTSTVTASTPVAITGLFGGATRSATVTVNPAGQAVTLTVTASGRSGERVTSSPAGINVAVGSTGSASFTGGTAITLSVSNGRDAIWSGACSSGGDKTKTCQFTPTANGSVTANVQ